MVSQRKELVRVTMGNRGEYDITKLEACMCHHEYEVCLTSPS